MFAHYFASKARKYLVITKGPACTFADRVLEIEGKTDARKRVAFYNARPWNF